MLKKISTTLLTLLLCMSFSFVAFAAESASPDISGSTAEIEKHTIEIEVAPGEEITEDDIMPLIWGEEYPGVIYNGAANTKNFYVSDRYFAFEGSAIGDNGQPVTNGTFAVALMHNTSIKASLTGDPDGGIYKLDWITMNSGTYHFRVHNYTSSILFFHITYYSWNT